MLFQGSLRKSALFDSLANSLVHFSIFLTYFVFASTYPNLIKPKMLEQLDLNLI